MSVLMTCKEKENMTSWSYINNMKELKSHIRKDIYSITCMYTILDKIEELLDKKNIKENKATREEMYLFALKSYFNKMNHNKQGLESFCNYYKKVYSSNIVKNKFIKKELDKLLESKKVYSNSSENFLLFLCESGLIVKEKIFIKQYVKNFNYFFKSKTKSVKWKVDLNNKNFMQCLMYFFDKRGIREQQVRDVVKIIHNCNLERKNDIIDFILANDVIVSTKFCRWCEKNLSFSSYKRYNKDILTLSVTSLSHRMFNALNKKRYSSNLIWETLTPNKSVSFSFVNKIENIEDLELTKRDEKGGYNFIDLLIENKEYEYIFELAIMSHPVKTYLESLEDNKLNSKIIENTFFIKDGEKFTSGICITNTSYDPYTLYNTQDIISFEKTNIYKYLNEGITHSDHSKEDRLYNEMLIRNFININYKEKAYDGNIHYLHDPKNIKKTIYSVSQILAKSGIDFNSEYIDKLNENKMVLLNLIDIANEDIKVKNNFYDIFDVLVIFYNLKNKEDVSYEFKSHYKKLINSMLNKKIGKDFLYKLFKMNMDSSPPQAILYLLETLLMCKKEVELEFIKNKTIIENNIGGGNESLYLWLAKGKLETLTWRSAQQMLLEFEDFKIRYMNKKTFFKSLAS